MPGNEERKLLADAHEKEYKSKELSEIFNISINSVNRIISQKKRTVSCEFKIHNSGRKPILTKTDLKNISELIDEQPDITINEIIEKLNLKAVNETVRKAVVKTGMYIGKNLCTLLSVNVPDVTEKREVWTEHLPDYDKNNLVFLDESGINIDLTRIYGRSAGGSRCVDKVPLSKQKNTTILSSIRLSGQTVYTTYQGGTNKDKFIDYLKNVLAPTLHENDIVIMDNMRTHHAKEVRKTIEDLKINVIYLPPYSPDFNPIEKMWSKIKSVLRKLKIRDSEALPHAVEYAFSKVRSLDCAGWFASCNIV